jgi:(Z)-2-((N-methylformamido)methylene)-5-hydroxybutyrolactone dehydrogenase
VGRHQPNPAGALIRRLADLVAERAEHLARVEVTDNGKLTGEMHGQLRCVPQFYRCFSVLADKLQGAVLPIDKPAMFKGEDFAQTDIRAHATDRS